MPADLAALRRALVARVRECGGATSEPVADALHTVPRHVFVPDVPPEAAYVDEAIVTKRDPDGVPISSSSQPTIMAIMLDQLGLAPGHRVLEIGAGTGYNAALMARIVGAAGEVVSIDIDADVVERARANLARAGSSGVTVVCADGAAGYAARAPFDRVIATVGVWDLAPAWLAQLGPAGRIVVPLDLRGVQRSIGFERAAGYWAGRSVVPCGFMRLRGALAGPELTWVLDRESALTLSLPQPCDLDADALLAALAGPAVEGATGVATDPGELFDGLQLWLALREPRCLGLSESDRAAALAPAPLHVLDRRITAGIAAGDSLAVLVRGSVSGPRFDVGVRGYGPHGGGLAAELAGQVRAWDAAGRPSTRGLRVDAYPSGGPTPAGALVIEKLHTRLALSWPATA